MILQTFLILLAVGVVVFLIGHVSDRPDIALIGAILIIGVGGVAVMDGLQIQTGESVVEMHDEENNSTTSIIEYTYDDITGSTNFPFEVIVMIVGAVMGFKAAGEISEL